MTTEKVQDLEINMAEIKKDITYIKDSQVKLDQKFDTFMESIGNKFKDLENEVSERYAKKYTEKLLWWLMGIFATAISYLIGKQ